MNIRKRTGEVVPFQEEKILNAMKKAFSGQGQEIDDRALDEMLSVVLKRLPENRWADRGARTGRGGARTHGVRTL